MNHFIGIGGIGMSGLARLLLQKGEAVSGSDRSSSPITKTLIEEGAKVFLGHDERHLPLNARVIYTTDVNPESNPEYREAKKRGLPLLHRSELLADLMVGSFPLLVAGTHGKTTTSSLLAHVLLECGRSPSYCVGGILNNTQSQAGLGTGPLFVAEADESDGSFLHYRPEGAIITNIDLDHLSYWKSRENLIEGFARFQDKVLQKDLLFFSREDPVLHEICQGGISYGFSPEADLVIEQVEYLGWKSLFTLRWNGVLYSDIELPLIGRHNVMNAAAVFGLCLQLGVDPSNIAQALASFQGAKRRSEKKGEVKDIAIYDDYGHHPTEIETTLDGFAKAARGRRLLVLFQPHRFTRTRDCFDEFGPALQAADLIFVTDIYGAGEEPIEGITSDRFYAQVFSQSHKPCKYATRDCLVEEVLACILPGDIIVSMGAGDITLVGPELLSRLSS